MIRTAIVGYGFSATTFHIPFIQADARFQLETIVSRKAEAVRTVFDQVTIVSAIEQLNCAEIDLVVITTPNEFHYDQVAYCLQQGCHVVVEKPFVLTSKQAQELAELARRVNKILVVFQNRRWDGDLLTVKSLIDANRIGELKRFTSRFDRFRPLVRQRWREEAVPGAGILWDLGPHLLDQAVYLFGKPVSIQANIAKLRHEAVVDDNFELWLDYGDFQVTLGSSSFQAGPNARFLIEGTQGTYIKYGLDPQEQNLKAGVDVTDDRWGQEDDEHWGILYLENSNKLITTKPGNYAAFWHQLAVAILEAGEPPVSLAESILVIQLIEFAQASQEQGKRLIVP